MSLLNYRPSNYPSPTDHKLNAISQKLGRFLRKNESMFLGNYLTDDARWQQFAIMITEFAEDVWCEVGMWKALEGFNQQTFGNPLPFSKPETKKLSDNPFDKYRISNMLWNTILIMEQGKRLAGSEIEALQSYIQDSSTSKDFILRLVKAQTTI